MSQEKQKYNTSIPVQDSQKIITDLVSTSDNKDDLHALNNLTIYGTQEDPLFQANDIEKLLEIKNLRQNIQNLRLDMDYIKYGRKTFIKESGFYKLIFTSRTKFAGLFQDFVCRILKTLRLNGQVLAEDMEKIKQELANNHDQIDRQLVQIEKLENSKMDLKGKNQILNYTSQKLAHEVNMNDKSTLSYHESEELNQLRESHYNCYHIYKTAEDDVFISMSNRITKYTKIDTIYLHPNNGFAKLTFLMQHKIKNLTDAKKIKTPKKVSPVYELECLEDLYECIEESRYFTGDILSIDF
jgi:prophage antirepressor-like protein